MDEHAQSPGPRILVVKLSSIGDLTHALPAVHGLKIGMNARIDWVTQPEYVEFVQCFDDVDTVIPFPRHGFWRGFPDYFRSVRKLRYDYVIDLQGLFKSGVAALSARTGRRIGPSFHREGAHLFYHEVCGTRDIQRHAVAQCMEILPHLGLNTGTAAFHVSFPKVEIEGPRPWVAISPYSRWTSKNWPEARFQSLMAALLERQGGTVFLVGGPGDREACERLAAGVTGRVVNLAGQHSLAETGGVLAAVDVLVSNDSGPAHIACAAGTPTVVLYGPTDAARTGPYGDQHQVIRAPSPCKACYDRECRRFGEPCLATITAEEVLETVVARVSGIPS